MLRPYFHLYAKVCMVEHINVFISYLLLIFFLTNWEHCNVIWIPVDQYVMYTYMYRNSKWFGYHKCKKLRTSPIYSDIKCNICFGLPLNDRTANVVQRHHPSRSNRNRPADRPMRPKHPYHWHTSHHAYAHEPDAMNLIDGHVDLDWYRIAIAFQWDIE